MRILILSGNGFLGKALIKELKTLDLSITILNTTFRNIAEDKETRFLDYSSQKAFLKILRDFNPTTIIHLASSCIREQSELLFKEGETRDINFINALLEWNKDVKIIFISSMACFQEDDKKIKPFNQRPCGYYGKEKSQMVGKLKNLCKISDKFNIKILYPSSIYGKHQQGRMFLPSLFEHIKKRKKMYAFGSEKRRDFIHIKNITKAISSIVHNFNAIKDIDIFIHSGSLISLGEISDMVAEILGLKKIDFIEFDDKDSDKFNFQALDNCTLYEFPENELVSITNGLREMFFEE